MQGDFNDDGGRGKEEENPGVVTLRSCSRVSPSVELLAQKWVFGGAGQLRSGTEMTLAHMGSSGGGNKMQISVWSLTQIPKLERREDTQHGDNAALSPLKSLSRPKNPSFAHPLTSRE